DGVGSGARGRGRLRAGRGRPAAGELGAAAVAVVLLLGVLELALRVGADLDQGAAAGGADETAGRGRRALRADDDGFAHPELALQEEERLAVLDRSAAVDHDAGQAPGRRRLHRRGLALD